jgi:hypothetical protein
MAALARRFRAAAAVVAALAFALSLGGCLGIFEPAKPENPTSGSSITVGNYTKPESCLYYMALGIAMKSSTGQDLYMGAFADSLAPVLDKVGFHAAFDDEDWQAYDGLKPADWGYSQEKQFYGSLVALFPDDYRLVWSEDPENPHDQQILGGDGLVAHRYYRLQALRQNDTLDVALGYADLTFRYLAPRWALVRWEDRVDHTVDRSVISSMGSRRLNAQIGG